ALDRLKFPDDLDFSLFGTTFQQIVVSFAIIVIIVLIIRLCIRLISFVAMILEERANLTNDVTDNQLIVFFKDFFKVILIIIGALLILRFAFHRDITQVFTGLSIVGAAMALAAKESLENLIASFIIFFDKPFSTGNVVKVLGITGTVEKIGLRSTRIRTDQKTYITVPNKQMVDTVMDNITQRTQRRVDTKLEISVSTNATQLNELTNGIKSILSGYTLIENQIVFLSDTGKNAHIIEITYFTSIDQTLDEHNELRHTVNLAIIQLIEKMKIELASSSSEVVVINRSQAKG
ncbi:MAG: mechanosensitive ion channel domain-containing protein, partial [Bacteroidota bacterium]